MKTSTLLEVMAEVGATAREVEADGADLTDNVEALYAHAQRAWSSALNTEEFRAQLKGAAARAIVALHAHDAEAADGCVDRRGHGDECRLERDISQCTFDCPVRRERADAAKAGA